MALFLRMEQQKYGKDKHTDKSQRLSVRGLRLSLAVGSGCRSSMSARVAEQRAVRGAAGLYLSAALLMQESQ